MLKAFIIEFDEVLTQLEIYKIAAWKKVFQVIEPSFKISDALMQKLLELKNSNKKILFWDDFRLKFTNQFLNIKSCLASQLVKFYDKTLLNILDHELTEDCLSPHFLAELERIHKAFDVRVLILNTSQLSDIIWQKLNLAKKYPFLELCFPVPKVIKSTHFLENCLHTFKTGDELEDLFFSQKLQKDEVVIIAENLQLLKLGAEINCFVVGVNNGVGDSYCKLCFKTSQEEIDLDRISFTFHARH